MLACWPDEGCGIVDTDNVFHACPNIHEAPRQSFRIDPKVWIKHKIKAIIHSHTYDKRRAPLDDPRIPSKADLQGQVATNVEWGIVVTEGENVTEPTWFGDYNHRPQLYEREFIHSAQDCLSFISDWYFQNYNVKLPACPREPDWFETGENFTSTNMESWGFETVNKADIQYGDLVMFQVRSDVPNHLGIYLGGDVVAHHLFGRLSSKDSLSKWGRYAVQFARFKK